MRVKFDEEERIVQIDTAQDLEYLEDNYTDGFCRTHKLVQRQMCRDPWSFDRSIYLTGSTQILMIPKDPTNANDNDYATGSYYNLKDWGTYYTEAYNSTKNYDIPEVIIVRTDSGSGSAPAFVDETPVVTVKSIVQVMNENEDIVKRVKVQNGSNEKYFDIDPSSPASCSVNGGTFTANDLDVGDLLRYTSDARGYIRLLDMYRDESRDEWFKDISGGSMNGIFTTTVSRKNGSYLFLPHWYSGNDKYGVVNLQEQTLSIGGITVIQYRKGREPYICSGSAADIEKGDKILLHMAYGQLIGIIVFK